MRLQRALFKLPVFILVLAIAYLPESFAADQELTPEFQKKFVEAVVAFKQKDLSKSEKILDEAEAIQSDTAVADNLRGAIKLEEGQIAAARELFQKALEKNPEFYPAKFNLAEIPFHEKEYAKARQEFQALLQQDPKNELVLFRIFLTYLLEKNMKEARMTLEVIPWPGDTPAYYFAKAAWEFTHNDPEEANTWIASAKRIFQPSANAMYFETLEEIGWLTRLSDQQEGVTEDASNE